ncbi:hypothetical protein RRG08_062462 [Elysia crispata]|uniref:Uncharacterized protein n=1 Tax=Elysia crispata TaxID=231223 RepID=A0AAE1CJM3_9GAST|nr:hypothetical protein RRG08_062462 [Elysia crispata]
MVKSWSCGQAPSPRENTSSHYCPPLFRPKRPGFGPLLHCPCPFVWAGVPPRVVVQSRRVEGSGEMVWEDVDSTRFSSALRRGPGLSFITPRARKGQIDESSQVEMLRQLDYPHLSNHRIGVPVLTHVTGRSRSKPDRRDSSALPDVKYPQKCRSKLQKLLV